MKDKNYIQCVASFIIILIFISMLSGCIRERETILVDGQRRSYIIHVPESYDGSRPTPLVIVLHGGGGNAKNIGNVSGFNEKADEEGFIVVYPDGTGKLQRKLLTWNAGFCCGYALENNIDDVKFLRTLIEHLQDQYVINESMVYATGLSNGGIMTYRIGAELSDIIAAIAPVAAQIGGQTTENDTPWQIPDPSNPVSVIAFNGMKDKRVPYDGGPPIDNGSHVYSWMSVNKSISFWVQQNHCISFPQRNISESGNIIIDTYSGGKNKSEVVLVSIVNGTHSWPGGQKGWENGDEPTLEISATDMMWDFFKNHPKTIG
jgi:polyhydroxybutyrate depolymerase